MSLNTDILPQFIIADHIRAACFLIADGVKPSGKQRGYILRRLIRRSLASSIKLNIDILNSEYFQALTSQIAKIYLESYPEIESNKVLIDEILMEEAKKYNRAIKTGIKEWSKIFKKEGVS